MNVDLWSGREKKKRKIGMARKRAENREGSLGFPGFVKPVFTKDMGKRDESFFTEILLTWVTPWSESPSKISASEEDKRSGSEMTPRHEFNDL
ncbi:hypothetical protein TNCV_2245551 [Trichonephila clavipes]|nr:hypothetical protein TNCV_2245551 [Trichonephila clavipes]